MSREAVRQAIVDFLDQQVEGLGQVYIGKPKKLDPNAYYQPGWTSGAIAYPYFTSHSERRVEMVGEGQAGLGKLRTYYVDLQVMFRAKARATVDAELAHDRLVDGICDRIASDPRLGTGGDPIWQAGEGDAAGGTDIEVLSDLPAREGDHTAIWTIVRFTALQWLSRT